MLFASRLSKEKGIFELPEIYSLVLHSIPDIKIVIAGSGPAEDAIKEQLPQALILGWVDKKRLAQLYAGLDLFIFPSRFDTFGNVVLEAFTYGLPVIAYNCKGPKDIIEHGVNGYLVENNLQMSDHIVGYFSNPTKCRLMRENAASRSEEFRADAIIGRYIADLGLSVNAPFLDKRSTAA